MHQYGFAPELTLVPKMIMGTRAASPHTNGSLPKQQTGIYRNRVKTRDSEGRGEGRAVVDWAGGVGGLGGRRKRKP